MTTTTDRYTIISADGHAGAELREYKQYLSSRWHDDFDAWAAAYVNPFADLTAHIAYRNWDSAARLAEHDQSGVVAEVLFPNTVPPFFQQGNLLARPPTDEEYPQRWAGLQAHNRWLASFCADAPGRRGGIAQIFLNRIEDTVAEVRWAAANIDVFAGVLLPAVPPNSHLHELWDPYYEPLWDVCEELDVPINVHTGSGAPDYGELEPARAIMLVELPWFAHRPVWHLILGGVLERHPRLRIALTEQGVAWLPRGIETLDWFFARMRTEGSAESSFFGAVTGKLTMPPSGYFRRNFWVGASFLRPSEAPLIPDIGVDRIMWGDDYPHSEGSYPFTTEALRCAFAGLPAPDVARMVGTNAAAFYGFDLDALRPIGDRIGPLVADVAQPITEAGFPAGSTCNAFEHEKTLKAW
jgi:predicted TIM-barrel fold metal-dependent hydrolase